MKAGFTIVELHDAGTLLSSDSGWRILLTAVANVTVGQCRLTLSNPS